MVTEPKHAAVSSSAQEALKQLKELLAHMWDESPWLIETEFKNPETTRFEVSVRPECNEEGRSYPVNQLIKLKIPCVCGKDSAGMLLASLPTLDLRFSYNDEADLKSLAVHYVQQTLRSHTPAEVALHLPPSKFWLEELSMSQPSKYYTRNDRFQPYQAFPGQAIPFVRNLVDGALRKETRCVTADQVLEHFGRFSGLPEIFLRDELPLSYGDVCKHLRSKIIGQDRACDTTDVSGPDRSNAPSKNTSPRSSPE